MVIEEIDVAFESGTGERENIVVLYMLAFICSPSHEFLFVVCKISTQKPSTVCVAQA